MLTYKTLDRFEAEYKTEQYTKAQIEAIELAAYIANMNRSAHRDWTDNDIFADFLRILDIDHIETVPARTAEGITEGITAALEKAMQTLDQRKDRSAWSRGVTKYAVDMLQQLTDYYKDGYISADDLETWTTAEAAALNGSWPLHRLRGCRIDIYLVTDHLVPAGRPGRRGPQVQVTHQPSDRGKAPERIYHYDICRRYQGRI